MKGMMNPAVGCSRTPNYEIGYERMTARFMASLAANTITESWSYLLLNIKAEQEHNLLISIINPPFVNVAIPDRY